MRKRALASEGVRNIKENIITKQALKKEGFFAKANYCLVGKNNCKCYACGEAGHYVNKCNNIKITSL